jgi:DNA-binding CsgD family transcriptional regulator
MERLRDSLEAALAKYRRALSPPPDLRSLAVILERLPMGVVLLDAQGKVLLANRRAGEMMSERDGLAVAADGALQLGAGATARSGGADRTWPPTGVLAVPRPSGRPPLSVLGVPLSSGPSTPERGHPSVALFVGDPLRRAECPEHLLCKLHGLTRAEARLTTVLIQGNSIEEAARQLSITRDTARTHLKRVFSKTGTSRQGELISLLLSSPALFGVEPPPQD